LTHLFSKSFTLPHCSEASARLAKLDSIERSIDARANQLVQRRQRRAERATFIASQQHEQSGRAAAAGARVSNTRIRTQAAAERLQRARHRAAIASANLEAQQKERRNPPRSRVDGPIVLQSEECRFGGRWRDDWRGAVRFDEAARGK
jgi:hypothetical protein